MNEGDWICTDPNCGNINFARRISCYRCNKERPDGGKAFKKKLGTEIGKSAAEKSRGLFNADDWQCNKCANVNWARRQTCNVCNAPKFGEVEARTGYGGGYNERGVVEYRRREPSSEDEYDEFGRKKRKRRDEQDKVGITEGPVNKKLPPTKLQKEFKLDYVKPLPPSQIPQVIRKDCDKNKGSLSDGSVCDVPVNKMAFRKYQQNQNNCNVQDNKLPFYKTNNQSRKRFSSIGDKEHTASSGYETGSKKSKHDNIPIAKTYNTPVMENRVSSTNNDFLYKYSAQAPTEEIQITYSIEEKVKAAAFAVVYNNCKISSEKFEAFYDKRAPNYQTLFAWRQRLLTTGCLVDEHTEVSKKDYSTTSVSDKSTPSNDIKSKAKVLQKQPNPDEIPILSESECEYDRDSPACKQSSQQSDRCLSADTLVLGVDETKPSRTSVSAAEDRESNSRSQSPSTQCRTRSSSRDSQDSNYPDSEPEMKSKSTKGRSVSAPKQNTPKQSVNDSDSCSLSYNSEDEDFLSRSFAPNGKKTRRKIKRRPIAPPKVNNYPSSDVQPFKGYSTLNSSAQSPLVTGNIYTSNLRNMAVKPRNRDSNNVVDTDGCSSEYVPTKLGATAKRNYQEFKNNVKRKGFWAKGNGASLMKPKQANQSLTYNVEAYPSQTQGYMSGKQNATQNREELLKNDIETFTSQKQYVLFNKPSQGTCTTITPNKFDHHQKQNQLDAKSIELSEKMVHIPPGDTSSLYTTNSPEKSMTESNKYRKPANNSLCIKTSDNLYGQAPQNINREFEKPVHNMYSSTPESTSHPISQQTTFSGSTQQRIPGFFDMQSQNAYTTAGNTSNIFDKLPISQKSMSIFDHSGQDFAYGKTREDSSSVFNIVQSNCARKNRSITDIFNLQEQNSPERGNDLDKTTDSIQKMYESQWDEDDDALYNTDTPDLPGATKPHASMQNNVDIDYSQTPNNNSLNNPDYGVKDIYNQSNKINKDFIKDKCENLIGLFDDIQRNKEISNIPNKQISHHFSFLEQSLKQNLSHISTALTLDRPDPIPIELSEEIKCMSEANETPKAVSPSKRVQILESIVIPPNSALQSVVHRREQAADQKKSPATSPSKSMCPKQDSHFQPSDTDQSANNKQTEAQSLFQTNPAQMINPPSTEANTLGPVTQNTPQLDISNLLAGINTNALLIALQNLQQFNQSSSATDVQKNEQTNNENTGENVETINLTNDEDWERESYREGSIERQLARMDGNTGDTPFLSDIFDPGPIVVPPNVAKKLNLNLQNPEDNKSENQSPHLNENAPVIGNFKSFALPKPILLNRLKLTVKAPERTYKKSPEDKKNKRKKKSKEGTSQEGEGGGEEDEEESGDEADLSKYDLWGSDGEQGPSSKHDDEEKDQEEQEASKDPGSESGDKKNGKSPSAESKGNRRRSRSSSSSSTSSSSSSSSHSSDNAPKNKFDDFNLNSERESVHSSPKGRKSRSRSRSRSPRARSSNPPARRKSRDSRSAGESRTSRDKEKSRERERRDGRARSRGACDDRKPRRYSRDGKPYSARGRHR